MMFVRKPTSPPFIDKAGCTRQFESKLSLRSLAQLFPIKEGFTSHPRSEGGNRPTRCSNRCAIRLADHQRSTPAAELRFLCGDEPAFTQGFAKGLLARCFFLKSTRPSFIDKAGCIRQFESELSLRSLAQLFPIKEGSFENPPVLPYP